MTQDRQGNALTAGAASAATLDGVIHDYYAWSGDILGALAAAVRDEPGFMLGHATIATILNLGGFRGDHPAITAAIAAAEAATAEATPRERAHLAIAKSLAKGELRRAVALCEQVLVEHPTDALALRYATDLCYYLGDARGIRDTVARALPAWPESDPIFGFVLARHAFGLEESGELDQAQSVARRALAINPEDAWATHTLAHVHEMRGRPEEGVRFLEETRVHWQAGRWLAVHNGWHLALFLIDLERGDEVLAKYDAFVEPRLKENFILDLIDAASLLWRLELVGVDVRDRWRGVAAIAAARIGEHVLAFNDLHVALALAGAKDGAAIERLIDSIDRYLAEGRGDNQVVTRDVGRALIAGVAAFGQGNYRQAVDALLPLRQVVVRIGGSHAQRALVEETLLAAAIRSENWALARAILGEHLVQRPTPRLLRLYHLVAARADANGALAPSPTLRGANGLA